VTKAVLKLIYKFNNMVEGPREIFPEDELRACFDATRSSIQSVLDNFDIDTSKIQVENLSPKKIMDRVSKLEGVESKIKILKEIDLRLEDFSAEQIGTLTRLIEAWILEWDPTFKDLLTNLKTNLTNIISYS